MILLEQINNILESLIKESLVVIFDVSVKVTKEIFKFIVILLLVYYFAIWSFQFLNEILQETSDSINPADLQSHENTGETNARIGPPDENLIKQRASLLEQLEIDAEFEVNQEKLLKSEADLEQFVKKEIHLKVEKVRDSDDIKPHKDLFISQIKQELNETSRASQTLKTSLGKKSKLKEEPDNIPTTSNRSGITEEEHDLIKKFEINIDQKIKKETLSDDAKKSTREFKAKRSSKEVKEEVPQYLDDQYDHESFYRV